MHSSFELWLMAGIALITGGAIGYFAPRYLKTDSNTNRALEEELQAQRDKHEAYREEVATHFGKTAELLAQLLGNYRDVHNHLAHGAEILCENANIKRLQPLPDDRLIEQQVSTSVEAPRDYAPKTATGGKSVLDEDFGIEKIYREPTPEPPRY